MAQDKSFLEENFNLHKSELDYLEETIKQRENWVEHYKDMAVIGDTLANELQNQISMLKEIKKSLLKLVELEKMYNIYQKTETDEKIIVGNILNILGDDK